MSKIAKITPIYKKSKLQCSNHKLVSLLSYPRKILERLIYNQFFNLLETPNFSCSLFKPHLFVIWQMKNYLDQDFYGCDILLPFKSYFLMFSMILYSRIESLYNKKAFNKHVAHILSYWGKAICLNKCLWLQYYWTDWLW